MPVIRIFENMLIKALKGTVPLEICTTQEH
jgi:hypothetical protein